MQTASRALDLKSPIRLMPMADIAGEGVKSFVDAEKALVDSMVKSRPTPRRMRNRNIALPNGLLVGLRRQARQRRRKPQPPKPRPADLVYEIHGYELGGTRAGASKPWMAGTRRCFEYFDFAQ